MNNLQVFNYNGNEVRTIQKDGEPWWVLKDVCNVLDLSDTNKTAERLDVDELTRIKFVTGGQNFVSTKAAYTTSFSAVISQKQSLSASGLHLRYCLLSASMGHT